jgi:hypothetical protein
MEDATQFVVLAEGIIASDFSLKSLNKALGEAQNEFSPAVKNEENKYGGYKYTPLAVIVSASRPALTKHHLTVSQVPTTDLENKTITVYSRLVHWDSGEWMQCALTLPAELALGKGGTPVFNQQTIGGSQTYAQKYAYKGILGIPDAEEMIDSTEEKGDLPARGKYQRGKYDPIATRHPDEGAPQFGDSSDAHDVQRGPTDADFAVWQEAFKECDTLEKWNKQIVPLMKERQKDPHYGRPFAVHAAQEAKRRGWTLDRTSMTYLEGAAK